jgi:hypothetical protein
MPFVVILAIAAAVAAATDWQILTGFCAGVAMTLVAAADFDFD